MSSKELICPVGGCDYSGKIASVAAHISGKKDGQHDWDSLGYEGANHFKRVKTGGSDHSGTSRLLHIADTHIGKESGGYGREQWPVDCMDGLHRAIDTAISLDVDAVLHTGDLFHNDRNGITDAQAVECGIELSRLDSAGIPFYYILGDHERKEGARWLCEYERLGLAIHLTLSPVTIGEHISLYGVDYKREEWWTSERWVLETPPANRQSILALHQSLTPFSNPDGSECDIPEILRQTRSNSGFQFDALALGQLHKQIDKPIDGSRVICGGATERLGKSKDSFTPHVGVFSTKTGRALSYQRYFIV